MSGIANLENELRRRPTDVDLLMTLAAAYRLESKLNDAARVYAGAAALDPNRAEAFFGAGSVMVELGKDEAAVPLLSAAVAKAPEDVSYWIAVGLAFERLLQLRQALAAFEAAEALARDREDIALHLLRVRFKLGLMEQVLSTTTAMQHMAAHYPEILLTRANALLILGRPAEARTAANQALRAFPNDPDVLAAAAQESLADDTGEAQRLLERAMRIAPDHYETMIGFGNLALRAGDFQSASMWLLRAWDRDPAQWSACLGLAVIAYEAKDLTALDDWTAKGIARAPWHPGLLDLRGRLLLVRGDPDGAEEVLLRAVRVNPFHQGAHFDLAQVFLLRGRRAEARDQLSKVVELAPDSDLGKAARTSLATTR